MTSLLKDPRDSCEDYQTIMDGCNKRQKANAGSCSGPRSLLLISLPEDSNISD
jgi:hypothetical protein